MATGTLIFRPSADVSVNHAKSSGSSCYPLIADATADDNSTYIYHTISSTSSSSVNSTFTLTTTDLPTGSIQITAARLYVRGTKSGNGETASYTCYFAAGTTSGGTSSNSGVSASLTSSYKTSSATSDSLVTDINSLLGNGEFPVISCKLTTSGYKNDSKDSNGAIRITQIYAEFDYETVGGTDVLYLKNNGSWISCSKAYLKVNDSWVEQDIATIFDTTKNYVKGN